MRFVRRKSFFASKRLTLRPDEHIMRCYIASALLAENDLRSGKHSGVHALFGEHFAKSGRVNSKFHRFLLDAFDRRIQADYGFDALISREEVAIMLDQAREFLAEAERILGA